MFKSEIVKASLFVLATSCFVGCGDQQDTEQENTQEKVVTASNAKSGTDIARVYIKENYHSNLEHVIPARPEDKGYPAGTKFVHPNCTDLEKEVCTALSTAFYKEGYVAVIPDKMNSRSLEILQNLPKFSQDDFDDLIKEKKESELFKQKSNFVFGWLAQFPGDNKSPSPYDDEKDIIDFNQDRVADELSNLCAENGMMVANRGLSIFLERYEGQLTEAMNVDIDKQREIMYNLFTEFYHDDSTHSECAVLSERKAIAHKPSVSIHSFSPTVQYIMEHSKQKMCHSYPCTDDNLITLQEFSKMSADDRKEHEAAYLKHVANSNAHLGKHLDTACKQNRPLNCD